MKRFRLTGIIFGIVVLTGSIIVVVSYISNKYFQVSSSQDVLSVISCRNTKIQHNVSIVSNVVMPRNTQASLCDTITITNQDNVIRIIAFGSHYHHISYDGITERVLSRGQSLTVTLNQTGVYQFHDHLDAAVTGEFQVIK